MVLPPGVHCQIWRTWAPGLLLLVLSCGFVPTATLDPVFTFSGFRGAPCFRNMAYSPDGAELVFGAQGFNLDVRDANSGALVQTLSGHTSGVVAVEYTADGTALVSGDKVGGVLVWHKSGGLWAIKFRWTTATPVRALSTSPDNARLVTAAGPSGSMVLEQRDLTTGAVVRQEGLVEDVSALQYNPNASLTPPLLAIGGSTTVVNITDADAGITVAQLKGPQCTIVYTVSWSPDGSQLVVGSDNDAVPGVLWTTPSFMWSRNTQDTGLVDNTGWIVSSAFSPEGDRFVTGSYDITARVWTAQGALQQPSLPAASFPTAIAVRRGGQQVAVAVNGVVKVWNISLVDCVMGEWTEWSGCSATCGNATRSQTRSILVPSQFGGVTCNATKNVVSCNLTVCGSPSPSPISASNSPSPSPMRSSPSPVRASASRSPLLTPSPSTSPSARRSPSPSASTSPRASPHPSSPGPSASPSSPSPSPRPVPSPSPSSSPAPALLLRSTSITAADSERTSRFTQGKAGTLNQTTSMSAANRLAMVTAITQSTTYRYTDADQSYVLTSQPFSLTRPGLPYVASVVSWGSGVTNAVVTTWDTTNVSFIRLGISPANVPQANQLLLVVIDRMNGTGTLHNSEPIQIALQTGGTQLDLQGLYFTSSQAAGTNLLSGEATIAQIPTGYLVSLPHTSAINLFTVASSSSSSSGSDIVLLSLLALLAIPVAIVLGWAFWWHRRLPHKGKKGSKGTALEEHMETDVASLLESELQAVARRLEPSPHYQEPELRADDAISLPDPELILLETIPRRRTSVTFIDHRERSGSVAYIGARRGISMAEAQVPPARRRSFSEAFHHLQTGPQLVDLEGRQQPFSPRSKVGTRPPLNTPHDAPEIP